MPVFSSGSLPAGPVRLDVQEHDALTSARIGSELVDGGDFVFADDDGVIFVAEPELERVLAVAHSIGRTERDQAERIRAGETLRVQTSFDEYLARRATDPEYSFRLHLRRVGGAIEE
jgi:4-hydroxy-4-methyl-2-oxoglutarate aldolase